MINRYIVELTKRTSGFNRDVFNINGVKPSYTPPKDSDVYKLMLYLGLNDLNSDYYLRVYLALLHFYFSEEDENTVYTLSDLQVGNVAGTNCSVLLEAPKFIYPEDISILENKYPFNVNWNARVLSDSDLEVSGLNFATKGSTSFSIVPNTNSSILYIKSSNAFPYSVQVELSNSITGGNLNLVSFGLTLEPSFFPYQACLDNLPNSEFVLALLKVTGNLKAYLQNIPAQHKLALILKAIMEYKE